MADVTPFGPPHAFGGTTIDTITYVASIGCPSIDRQPVEAYEQILGNDLPIDLFNGVAAPRKDVFTCDFLVRANDADTNPVTAWQHVAAGYRSLAGLPETGSLVVYSDTSLTGTVSCSARRKPIPLTLTPKNARHYVVTIIWTLLSDWA